MSKIISILGSTGSIGLSSLSIIEKKKKYFRLNVFSANKNYKQICNQIIKYKPKFFVISDYPTFKKIKKKFNKNSTKILNSFEKINCKKSDITISAIPGIDGLPHTINFIKKSKKILIANKESIICGWNLINSLAKKTKTKIIPIDSEHFSILKLLESHKINDIKKIYLTASGGPFLNYKISKIKNIKARDALSHPKWKMGKKISVDSATMMNKMLELIEAQKLFGIPKEKLEIIIHPESLVHAIIELENGLLKFIYHETSMIVPIANAIFDGKLDISSFLKNKTKIENLSFKKPDKKIFPILKIKDKITEFKSTPIILNSANEVLVEEFLKKKLPFLSISKVLISILKDRNYKNYAVKEPSNIDKILKITNWAKKTTYKKLNIK